jgi:hypothetical protein
MRKKPAFIELRTIRNHLNSWAASRIAPTKTICYRQAGISRSYNHQRQTHTFWVNLLIGSMISSPRLEIPPPMAMRSTLVKLITLASPIPKECATLSISSSANLSPDVPALAKISGVILYLSPETSSMICEDCGT